MALSQVVRAKKNKKKKKKGGSSTAQYTQSAQRANHSSSMETWPTASSVPTRSTNWSRTSSRQPRSEYYVATNERQLWYEHKWEGAHAWGCAPGGWHCEHQWNGTNA